MKVDPTTVDVDYTDHEMRVVDKVPTNIQQSRVVKEVLYESFANDQPLFLLFDRGEIIESIEWMSTEDNRLTREEVQEFREWMLLRDNFYVWCEWMLGTIREYVTTAMYAEEFGRLP